MSEENTFNTAEDFKIGEILKKAFSIKDKEERAIFIENECCDNLIMFEYVMESLDEMDFGESGFFNLALESGNEVGNYIIIKKINEGGIASVYSAEHKVLKTLAAIKVFDKLDVKNIENDLFWNTDHTSLSRFNHDNIVKLYDVGFYEKNGNHLPYIAVEFVKGKHLDDYCKSNPRSIREVLRLFQHLCEVIEFIHDKGIIHLDLKPKNILVTSDRPHRIKLIDFGSSKPVRSESKLFTRLDLLNPVTLKFASPEQFDGNEVLDYESDIYSLGVILYLLITEKVPFGDQEKDKDKITQKVTDINLLPILPSERVLELKYNTKFGIPLKTLNEILSRDLDSIIMKALEKRRHNRYQSVTELRRDIDNFLKGKPVKARRKTSNYIINKAVAQFLGFKGGLTGWNKWKVPLRRLSIFAFLLALLGFIGIIYFQYQSPSYTPIGKRVERPKNPMPIRVFYQTGPIVDTQISDKHIIYIYCGPEAQEEICFTFMKIPKGQFIMGLQGNETFTSGFETVKNKLIPKQTKENQLKKDNAFNIGTGMSEGPVGSVAIDEKSALPKHEVKITKDFYMAKFEITNKQWNLVAKTPIVKTELEVTDNDSSLPKTNVSYDKAVEFCERLTAELKRNGQNVEIRLPSEAEWEYACRAESVVEKIEESEEDNVKSGKIYNPMVVNAIILPDDTELWVERLMKNVNKPLPESSLLPNNYGLVGLNGNVWEMVADAWHDKYEEAKRDEKGEVTEEAKPGEMPWGNPASDENKKYVLRGGSYNESDFMTQCSYRKSENYIFEGNGQIGFRIVMVSEGLD